MKFLMLNPIYHCDPMTREPFYADRERYFNRYKTNTYDYRPKEPIFKETIPTMEITKKAIMEAENKRITDLLKESKKEAFIDPFNNPATTNWPKKKLW